MMPHTVNACFVPERNEFIVPAAILRPPIFDASKPPAYNYGSFGAILGHEPHHAFDPSGRQFDGNGFLVADPGDVRWYEKLVEPLDRQAARNGENAKLTSGENVADLAGVRAAFHAMKNLEHGYEGPQDDQIFFTRFAQVWACKMSRPDSERRKLTDPHGPPNLRCNMTLMNMEAFYAAYGVLPGDGMFLPENKRAQLWFPDNYDNLTSHPLR